MVRRIALLLKKVPHSLGFWTGAVLLTTGAVALCVAWIWFHGLVTLHGLGPYSPTHGVQHWKERIQAVGPAQAYEELARSVDGDPLGLQHDTAHEFGEALYDEKGIAGIGTCDTRFYYGCFHYFIAMAVLDHGLSVIPSLAKTCTTALGNPAACLHGVGHALVSNLGYSLDDLKKALRICGDLSADPYNYCMSGVYMEYNGRTMLQPLTKVEQLNAGSAYGVCDVLQNPTLTERRWCIFTLSRWWSLFHVPPSQQGRWCAALTEAPEKITCYEAIGRQTVYDTQASADMSQHWCTEATSDPEMYAHCMFGAAFSWGYGKHPDTATEICSMLPEYTDRVWCGEFATGERVTPSLVPLKEAP